MEVIVKTTFCKISRTSPLAVCLALLNIQSVFAAPGDVNWTGFGGIPGPNGAVYAAAVDGSGNLYIGGDFTIVGDVFANRIAKWDGSTWSALGSGMNAAVRALVVVGGDVYAGGEFTTAGGSPAQYIAKWDGSAWSTLGSGVGGNPPAYVYALAVSGADLYVGGKFSRATNSGGLAVTVNRIAKWNGNEWTPLGSGMNSDVRALAVFGSDVYAGGYFTTAGGSPAYYVAKWDGNTWSALGVGLNNSVSALAMSGADVYAGGRFTSATNSDGLAVTVSRIAKWNGNEWTPLGSGMSGGDTYGPFVAALAVSGDDVYVGGDFYTAGGSAANYIAKWNGTTWSALGSGIGGFPSGLVLSVYALAVSGGEVYAGGDFRMAGGMAANHMAKWNGGVWSALGSGMGVYSPGGPTVEALAVLGDDLYAGGSFLMAGSSAANYIAKWNGGAWSALGSGINDYVYALAVSGSDVYAGGSFTKAGGSAANYIAKWNGSAWSALGSGLNGAVIALAVSGNDLYAGGAFTTATNSGAAAVTVNRIAKWNGSAWSALGSGINDYVYALAVSGSNVYAGGSFTNAGGVAANYVAKWNGNSWSALNSGVVGYPSYSPAVRALAVSGGDLYVGGSFTNAGGGVAKNIAKWNGSTWSALGAGMNAGVRALAVSGSDVYAGGVFTTAGGGVANRIAKWDGGAWSTLGSGVGGSSSVYALAVSGNDLYAGGLFMIVGGKVSGYVGKWAPLAFRADSVTVSDGVFQALLTGPDTNTVVVDVTATFTNWTPVATNILPPGGAWQLSFPIGTNDLQFYRARFGP